MERYYRLDDTGTPVQASDRHEWWSWVLAQENRDTLHVAKDEVGSTVVSTIFTGIDSSDPPNDPPEVFDTVVWGGHLHGVRQKYTTRDDALAGHRETVDLIRKVGQDGHVQDDGRVDDDEWQL